MRRARPLHTGMRAAVVAQMAPSCRSAAVVAASSAAAEILRVATAAGLNAVPPVLQTTVQRPAHFVPPPRIPLVIGGGSGSIVPLHGGHSVSGSSAAKAAASGAARITCNTPHDVQRWVDRIYTRELWEEMVCSSSVSGSSSASSSSLLHVTSVFRPRGSSGGDPDQLYTLRVGPGMPSHPSDRFALSLSRSLARTVLYSGKILREEPRLRCQYDEALAPGLRALRAQLNQPALPDVAVMTRGRADALDFAHPLFDVTAEQAVRVYYAEPSYAYHLRQVLAAGPAGAKASLIAHPTEAGSFSVPLGILVSSAAGGGDVPVDVAAVTQQLQLLHPATPKNPSKLIHFQCIEHLSVHEVCELVQRTPAGESAATTAAAAAAYPFLRHVSVEAGPSSTADLYAPSSHHSLPPPVRTLLLTVYRGPMPPQHYRRFLVFPGEHALDSHKHDADPHPHPPPTLTQTYIEKHYRLRSEHRSETDPDWTFFRYERGE